MFILILFQVLLPILLFAYKGEESEEYEYKLNQDYIIGDEDVYDSSSNRTGVIAIGGSAGHVLPLDEARSAGKPPREVTVGLYIQRALWEVTEQIVGSHKESAVLKFLRGQVTRAFNLANQNLRRLDNGGYKVKFNGTIQRLESSDVKIKKTYVDRLDGNKTKKFDHSNIFSHTFTFQEAVEKMPDRQNVHLRLLALLGSEIEQAEMGAAEEHCICDFEWFGCVLVLGIRDPSDWTQSSNLLTHEFGHTLGATLHDDEFYDEERAPSLIMWSKVDSMANVWSKKARQAIKEHDKSCLGKNKTKAGEQKKKKKRNKKTTRQYREKKV